MTLKLDFIKRPRSIRDLFNKKALKKGLLGIFGAAALVSVPIAIDNLSIETPAAAQQARLPMGGAPTTIPVTPGCDVVAPHDATPYDETLFAQNDPTPAKALAAMSGEQRVQYYLQNFCFTADQRDSDNNPRDAHLVQALDTLSTLTYMGRPLIDLAVENKLHFCALPHLPAGTAAQYLAGHDFVVATRNAESQGEVLDLAHEITHAAQGRNGLLSYNYNWDIESRVRRNLTIEAAPVALEYAVAYEKKLNGDDSYWNYLKAHNASSAYTNPENHRLFELAYQKGIDGGADQGTALRAAAKTVFEQVFKSEEWRNFYLNSELNSYLDDIAANKFITNTGITPNAFAQPQVDLAGKVGSLPSFTAGAHVPGQTEILSFSQKWVWAYEAADIARYKQAMGDNAPAVIAKVKSAQAGKNPYLALDMAAVATRAKDESWKGTLQLTWQLMDQMLTEPKPAANENTNCPKPAVVVLPPSSKAASAQTVRRAL